MVVVVLKGDWLDTEEREVDVTELVAEGWLVTVETLFELNTTDDESVIVVAVARFEEVVGAVMSVVCVLEGVRAVGLDKLDPDVSGTEDK